MKTAETTTQKVVKKSVVKLTFLGIVLIIMFSILAQGCGDKCL